MLALLPACSLHRINPSPTPLKGASVTPPLGETRDPTIPPWWDALASAPLDTLIRRGLDENLDVAAARERIHQSLASRRIASAGFWPEIDAEFGLNQEVYARGRSRQNGLRREAGLALDWDVDLFGRQAGTRLARAAETWTSVYAAEDFRLTLSADIADTYYGIVEQRRLLALLDEQKGTTNELLRIIEQRYEEGLISNLDVLQQQTQLAELESQIPVARAALQDLQNRLGALLAALPGEPAIIDAGIDAPLPVIGPLAPLENADALLRLRPDLRAAQASLVAADAETASALADRLPGLSLSGDALRVSGRSPAVTTVTLGADLVQPLLDWGARREVWVRAKAEYRERLATYSQAYLRAVWQVEALLQNGARQDELLESLARRRSLLEATIKQARSRYDAGLTDYLPVLSATQQLYSVEQRLVRERRRLVSLRIALHRALGGPVPADPAAPVVKPPPKR
jgi:NodT family efflux transporter outer membrane factor (OMF) lipoprotein